MQMNAEKKVIGALLLDPTMINRCVGLLPNMFIDPILGDIFREYQKAADLGQRATVSTIVQKLSAYPEKTLSDVLNDCLMSVVTSVEIQEDAEVVMKAYRTRVAKDIINKQRFNASNIDRQIGELINELESLRDARKTAVSISNLVDNAAGKYFTAERPAKLFTGFSQLDETLGGFEGGDVIVIGARPAVGKSAFALQIAQHVAQKGKRVLIYNLEMTEQQIYERMLAQTSGIGLQRIRKSLSFLHDEQQRFEKGNSELKKLDMMISSGSKTVGDIRAECRNLNADLIIIDYLQLVRTERRFTNRASEVGDISKSIKALAMELGVPIIILSQLNRLSEGRSTKAPTMAELRESGDIEQDASVIILLWNCNEDDRSQKGLSIEKNRQGETTKTRLQFDGTTMQFTELINAGFNFEPALSCPF